MFSEKFIYLGIFINALGLSSYFLDTIKGKIKPNRVSMAMWIIAPLVAFFAQAKQGVGTSSLMTLSTGILPIFIFLGTFFNKKSYWKLTRFDFICGAISIIGLGLWQITEIGNVAIFFSMFSDFWATVPTLVKAYKFPKTEPAWPWLAISSNGLFTLLTIKTWDFANTAWPLYFFLSALAIFIVVQFKLKKVYAKLRSNW